MFQRSDIINLWNCSLYFPEKINIPLRWSSRNHPNLFYKYAASPRLTIGAPEERNIYRKKYHTQTRAPAERHIAISTRARYQPGGIDLLFIPSVRIYNNPRFYPSCRRSVFFHRVKHQFPGARLLLLPEVPGSTFSVLFHFGNGR